MATSGTTAFNLEVADVIEEAYERIGIEMRSGYDARTARRSINLLLQNWSNRQVNLWKMVETSQALTQGTASYTLASDIIDIKNVVLRRSSIDTNMHRLSRDDYQKRPNKTTQARPSQFWVERLTTPVLHLYPTPVNSTDTVRFYAMERIEDIGAAQETVDIPSRFIEPLVSGLSFYLALKRKPELAQAMKGLYEEAFSYAMDEDRERVAFTVVPKVGRLP